MGSSTVNGQTSVGKLKIVSTSLTPDGIQADLVADPILSNVSDTTITTSGFSYQLPETTWKFHVSPGIQLTNPRALGNDIEDLLIKVFRWISGSGDCPQELDKLLAEFKDDVNSSHQGTRQKALGKAVAQTLLWVLGELDEEDEQK